MPKKQGHAWAHDNKKDFIISSYQKKMLNRGG